MKLRDNAFGFDINLDNPFRIFRYLRHIAQGKVGEENIVDLSRGDPGYGFYPSSSGRSFYSFLLNIDTLFNGHGEHFVTDNRDDFSTLWRKIQDFASTIYTEKKTSEFLENFYFFITRIEKYALTQGLQWDKRKILYEIFKYSTVSGGCYHDPQGEILIRLVIASHHNEKQNLGISYKDLILTQGVSHGIGTIFQLLCDERIGYLKPGDSVLMTSPAYAPYNTIAQNRGLNVIPLRVNPTTGKVIDLESSLKSPTKAKLLCIIDPNNPTGFMFEESFLENIARFAEEHNLLILSDEVYSDFFFARRKSMLSFAYDRTIVMTGRSKIERATGLRFAEYIIPEKTDKYISEKILLGRLNGHPNLKTLFIAAKGPGGINGEFQHTTFVPGPSQYLGISHMIFGDDDREEYLKRIRVNMENFYEILGLPYNKNFYYACFDLRSIPSAKKLDKNPEELFLGLAEKGVVLIPANLFFSEIERSANDYRTFARASLANLNFTQLTKAANAMREFMML